MPATDRPDRIRTKGPGPVWEFTEEYDAWAADHQRISVVSLPVLGLWVTTQHQYPVKDYRRHYVATSLREAHAYATAMADAHTFARTLHTTVRPTQEASRP